MLARALLLFSRKLLRCWYAVAKVFGVFPILLLGCSR